MKKIFLFLILSALAVFYSCRVLTKTQVKNVNAFAKAAKSYTFFPGQIIETRAGLVLEERLVGATQLPADQIKISLANAQSNYELQLKLADKIDLSLKLIRQYASLLNKLSSDEYVDNLTKDASDLDDNLTGLVNVANTKFPDKVPANVGNAITKAVFLLTKSLTKTKQAKALKQFIPQGDTLIKITVKNIVDGLSDDLPAILAGDKQKFINTYTNTILVKESKIDYNSLKQYLVGLNNYDNLEQLRKNCIKSANKLALAHEKLKTNVMAKSNLNDIFQETQEFIVSLQDLYKSFNQLSSKK